jgi:hypothetical protein
VIDVARKKNWMANDTAKLLYCIAFVLGATAGIVYAAGILQPRINALQSELNATQAKYAYFNASDYADLPCAMVVSGAGGKYVTELKCNPSAKMALDLHECEYALKTFRGNESEFCSDAGWVPRPAGFDRGVNLTYAGNCIFCVKGFCGVVPNCTASTPFSIIVGNETYNYSTNVETGSKPSEYRIGMD